jgi:uncharacterized protein (TIGR02246 family)
MSSQIFPPQDSLSNDKIKVRRLYRELLDSWNKHSADTMATLFAEDGELIGFDGSQLSGRAEIASTLRQIFADHVTPPYVSKVRGVRPLSPGVAVLHTVVGIVPAGQPDLDPNLNATQTLIAAKQDDKWRIALFQNTPAQFHGRPESVHELTEELQQLLE